jgi:hypothetical protein
MRNDYNNLSCKMTGQNNALELKFVGERPMA